MTLPYLKVEFDGSSGTNIVTARRKVISSSLSSLFTAEALLHSADFSNPTDLEFYFNRGPYQTTLFGLRFLTSLLNDVTLRASRDECLLFMGIRIRSLPPRKPMDPTDLGST